MRKINVLVLVLIAAVSLPIAAQVLSPGEIGDASSRDLQEKYFEQLKQFGVEARAHKFPYAFSFSRVLDVELPQQAGVDQRSVRFDVYNNRTVLEMTGNYFASYSTLAMDFNHRTRQTFSDVVLPLLKMAVPRFNQVDSFQAYAFEISYHIRNKVLGVENESFENVVYIFPRAAAERLVSASTPEQQQGAVLDGQVLVNGEPFMMWLTGDPPPGQGTPRKKEKNDRTEVASLQPTVGTSAPIEPTVNPKLLGLPEPPVRIVTAGTLGSLQAEYREVLARMVRELDSQAHFVPYAPPGFIAFKRGAYLQLSVTTPLDANASAGSRYKVAALAFDEHIAHLVRPVLAYFQPAKDFDGISFATSVKFSASPSPVAIEFMLPVKALRCYANFDCTGQQLIDSGIVLMNGDRISLELQTAEK
ncbi:MAG: hypothetical protein ACR2IF_03340 [Terriglobales bacterium]